MKKVTLVFAMALRIAFILCHHYGRANYRTSSQPPGTGGATPAGKGRGYDCQRSFILAGNIY